ncbi:hypothetical protein HMPREF1121_00429 [Porphyromonas sp. KLE 1280]|jgi:hypothetical protein|uniref:hypothetical protein n=1 Tax=Porphyromonas sp. KLE 1280 TaxID=997829 RepID=UPI0004DA8931|nr:hypothetical protein [Porphyromonas sp. KLE 1280]KDU79690.1 hypothetical protein HMPREF1121_00429 [Porphyromonas sp. KLE 1280]
MSENMKALYYESLIRAVFKCDRFGVAGADADIYRRLERVSWGEPSESVDQFELGVSVGEVAAHIDNALEYIKGKHLHNQEFIEKIEECICLLCNPTKEKIDECIDKAWEAFRSIGLTVS